MNEIWGDEQGSDCFFVWRGDDITHIPNISNDKPLQSPIIDSNGVHIFEGVMIPLESRSSFGSKSVIQIRCNFIKGAPDKRSDEAREAEMQTLRSVNAGYREMEKRCEILLNALNAVKPTAEYDSNEEMDRAVKLWQEARSLYKSEFDFSLSELVKALRKGIGYIENGTSTTIEIFQDDATRDYMIIVGREKFYGQSLGEVLQKLIEHTRNEKD